jgi:hypothetical protein
MDMRISTAMGGYLALMKMLEKLGIRSRNWSFPKDMAFVKRHA